MTPKFNPKKYLGKNRIYRAIPNAPGLSRLYAWNPEKAEYVVPANLRTIQAKRTHLSGDGESKREVRFHKTVEDARAWQRGNSSLVPSQFPMRDVIEISSSLKSLPGRSNLPLLIEDAGPTFAAVVDMWKKRRLSYMQKTSQVRYETLLKLYFDSLYLVPIRGITPQVIDRWLDELKEPTSWTMKSAKRKNFKYELSLLRSILKYYMDYHDDPKFVFPIKQRHKDGIKLNRPKNIMAKDLTPEEFFKFRDELGKSKYGATLYCLSTVHYFQALRISEAAGIFHEDVLLEVNNPSASRLKIIRSVKWPRRGGMLPILEMSFKNSESNQGIKEQPLFPESFRELRKLWNPKINGLMFHCDGKPFSYRQLQSFYDCAFKRAGLPYRGTHVLRHGGCRNVYNQTSDLEVAKQLLGNSDLKSTLVYAKRSATALTDVAKGHWDEVDRTGCRWLQEKGPNEKA